MENKVQTACHHCDLFVEFPTLSAGQVARCPRCNGYITSETYHAVQKALAYTCTALICLVLANLFPFITFSAQGQQQVMYLIPSMLNLFNNGYMALAIILSLYILLIPGIQLLLQIRVYAFLYVPGMTVPANWEVRWIYLLQPWNMVEVFLIGTLVSLVKIISFGDVSMGVGFWAYIIFSLGMILALLSCDRLVLWRLLKQNTKRTAYFSDTTTHQLLCCHHCGLLSATEGHCQQCDAILHRRKPVSLQRTWAFLIVAIILYFPANLLPIMNFSFLGQDHPSTIMDGIIYLWSQASYPIAIVIFVASFLVPTCKILAIIWLCYSVQYRKKYSDHSLTLLYQVTEFVGRWSMIDVFVVVILVTLVHQGEYLQFQPGIAALSFAGVVIMTMLSAMSFDPRIIWDVSEDTKNHINPQQK